MPVEPTPDPRRPDPRIPYVHGRDLVPLRRQPRRFANPHHEALFAAEDDLRARIRRLDQQLLDLGGERRRLLGRIAALHDRLRPSYANRRGRRRRAVDHEEPLPPTPPDAAHLAGRALRAICLTLLRQARRALTLRELHAHLHRAGYAIAHHHPAKALADALGHETDAGRARRVARGTYRAGPPPNHPTTDHPTDDDTAIPDW